MKTIIYFILLATICLRPSILFGQDEEEKLYKGIRFGYQNSNLSESSFKELSSFYAGIFGGHALGGGHFLSIYTGLEYYQTGTKENDDNEIVLSYLSLPINLRGKLGPVYAFLGVNPSLKVHEKVKILGADVSDATSISAFDMGSQFGLGARIAFIGIEVKYNLGFIDIWDGNKTSHLQAGLCVYL